MSNQPINLEIWQRADISPRDLAALRRHDLNMRLALVQIEALAAEEIQAGVVTSKSRIPKIIEIAQEAIVEAK